MFGLFFVVVVGFAFLFHCLLFKGAILFVYCMLLFFFGLVFGVFAFLGVFVCCFVKSDVAIV